jgi:hypothetical protein
MPMNAKALAPKCHKSCTLVTMRSPSADHQRSATLNQLARWRSATRSSSRCASTFRSMKAPSGVGADLTRVDSPIEGQRLPPRCHGFQRQDRAQARTFLFLSSESLRVLRKARFTAAWPRTRESVRAARRAMASHLVHTLKGRCPMETLDGTVWLLGVPCSAPSACDRGKTNEQSG